MKCSEQMGELAAALAKAQAEICARGAVADSKNPHFKSTYADLSSVMAACGPLFAHGLALVQTTRTDGESVLLVTRLIHSSGQWIEGEYPVRPVKTDPQGYGSALTYARRYTVMAMLGIAPVDDDGEAAMGRDVAQQRQPQRQEQQYRSTPQKVQPPPMEHAINEREFAALLEKVRGSATPSELAEVKQLLGDAKPRMSAAQRHQAAQAFSEAEQRAKAGGPEVKPEEVALGLEQRILACNDRQEAFQIGKLLDTELRAGNITNSAHQQLSAKLSEVAPKLAATSQRTTSANHRGGSHARA